MTSSNTDTSPAPLIPRKVLFGNPERVSPRISPDGSRLAFIAPVNGVLNVWVGESNGDDFSPVTNDTERGIRNYFWAHDNEHLLYLQDQGGDENWQLHGVHLASGKTTNLTPFDKVQVQVLELDKSFPNLVMLGINKDNPELHDVHRLNLRTGDLDLVTKNPGFVGWMLDAEFQVRGGVTMTAEGGIDFLVRSDGTGDDWRTILSVDAEDAINTNPTSFTLDGSGLYAVTSKDANAGRLVRIDVATGDMEVIAEDPHYDVSGVRLHPDTREVQVVAFVKERVDYRVLDPDIEEDLAIIRSTHAGDLQLEGSDDSDRNWLVAFNVDDGPVAYYSYSRDDKQAKFLFNARPALTQYDLAHMEPFSYEASDGLIIHGYLTFPRGLPHENLPVVLNVHGGPWARDFWGYNPEAQWLANRGYLCAQVNYRGSTGYGKDFVNAGDREWAGRMHTDLIEAVEWMVEKGYADRSRVAIYGGSYGGYAALVGATFTPDLFACAIDLVGPSSLKTLIESIPPYWTPLVAQFHKRIGNPETESDFLWSRSPLSRVDNISIPVLVAQGANDPRVKQSEAEQIVAAMKEKGIDHEYLLFPDEGHGFAKPENRMRFYAAAERFLARHIGGRFED